MSQSQQQEVVSIHRAASVRVIEMSGGYAVKARPGQKEPSPGWDPRTNSAERSAQLLSQIRNSSDNIGIHLHGIVVDVDIDGNDPFLMAALDALLPPTPHIWGRNSRPRTHRLYQLKIPERVFDPTKYPVLRRLKRLEEVRVELRGGPPNRGEYSLLPGSTHPDGEPYEWMDVGKAAATPAVVEPDQLIGAIRKAGTIAVIAQVWQEGLRQQITMALAGFIYRCMSIALSLGADSFAMNLEDGLAFLDTLMEVLGDDDSDRHMRRKAFEKSWVKADRGLPVTGATTLADLGGNPDLVKKLYALLSDNPSVELIENFCSQFAIWKGPALAIDLDLVAIGESRPFMTRRNFASSYGDKFVDTAGGRKLLPELLWSLPSALRVHGLTFDPTTEDRICYTPAGDKINQWTGFEVEPGAKIGVSRFTDYLEKVVCNGNKELYEWVLAWCADIFQRPGNKPGTALVLVGTEGVGKSFLGHQILGRIIGTSHYAATNNIENLTRNFNTLYTNRILIQCDEAINSRQKSHAAKLKSLITDPIMTVEPKGVDQYLMPNHSRILFTSNEVHDAIHMAAGMADRRYTVIEVAPHMKGKIHEYWAPFVEWLDTEGVLPGILRFLLNHKYDPRLIRLPFVTEAKIAMQEGSWEIFDLWLAAMLARGHPLSERVHRRVYDAFPGTAIPRRDILRDWPTYVYPGALAEDYKIHVGQHNQYRGSNILNEQQLLHRLKKALVLANDAPKRTKVDHVDDRTGMMVRKNIRLYPAPSQDGISRYLMGKYGYVQPPKLEDIEELKEEE